MHSNVYFSCVISFLFLFHTNIYPSITESVEICYINDNVLMMKGSAERRIAAKQSAGIYANDVYFVPKHDRIWQLKMKPNRDTRHYKL